MLASNLASNLASYLGHPSYLAASEPSSSFATATIVATNKSFDLGSKASGLDSKASDLKGRSRAVTFNHLIEDSEYKDYTNFASKVAIGKVAER